MADAAAEPSTALEFIDVEAGEGEGEGGGGEVGSSAQRGALPSLHPQHTRVPTEDPNRPDAKAKAIFSSMTTAVMGAKHPVAAIFHLLFKGLALFVYLFGSILWGNYVLIFVLCIICLAFDFWTVKNISGRLLVGLRWWNRINDDGSSEWVFESQDDQSAVDALDARVFWMGLYMTPGVWAFLLLIAVLKLNIAWAVIVVVALVLSSANIIGYTKCRKDAKQKMDAFMAHGPLGALSASAGSKLLSTLGEMAMKSAVARAQEGANGARKPRAGGPMTV